MRFGVTPASAIIVIVFMEHDIIPALFEEVVELARKQVLLSEDYFSVDGTLYRLGPRKRVFVQRMKMMITRMIKAATSSEIFMETRLNDIYELCADPDARSYKKFKGCEAKMVCLGIQ